MITVGRTVTWTIEQQSMNDLNAESCESVRNEDQEESRLRQVPAESLSGVFKEGYNNGKVSPGCQNRRVTQDRKSRQVPPPGLPSGRSITKSSSMHLSPESRQSKAVASSHCGQPVHRRENRAVDDTA